MSKKIVPIVPLFGLVFIPGTATLVYGIWTLMGLPYALHILGGLAFVSLCMGTYISIRKIPMFASESDGEFSVIESDTGVSTYSLNLDTDLEDLPRKKTIVFRVQKDIRN